VGVKGALTEAKVKSLGNRGHSLNKVSDYAVPVRFGDAETDQNSDFQVFAWTGKEEELYRSGNIRLFL